MSGTEDRPGRLGIGLIGYGYWGPHMARNISHQADGRLTAICETDPARRAIAAREHPGAVVSESLDDLLTNADVAAVAIATPVSSHFPIAQRALELGRHVLLAKPMTSSVAQAEELVEMAQERDLTLMVDHTFVYTAAVRLIGDLVREGAIGDVYYYDSTRVNLGLFQRDVNVIWDLAVHDLAIIDYIFPNERVLSVSAQGARHVGVGPESLAYITLTLTSDIVAHISVNWLSPVKIRQTIIGGSAQMIVWDDVTPTEKVRVYDRGAEAMSPHEAMVSYRSGDIVIPQLSGPEALYRSVEHFIDCARTRSEPLTGGRTGVRIVRLLEAAAESLTCGHRVDIP